MAQKKSYSRYFIILQEDENGYALASDKLPSGYAKLETKNDKCKVSYYVQNLKKEKEPYYMLLICNKKEAKKLIKVGLMNIDEFGRTEITYEYDVDNVAGSSVPVDLIGGAAVVKLVDSNIVSVMSGFTSTEIPKDWKSYTIFETQRNSSSNVEITPVESNKVETSIQSSEPESPSIRVEEKELKNIFDEYEQKIEEIKQDEAELERQQNVIEEDLEIVEVDGDKGVLVEENLHSETSSFEERQPVSQINDQVTDSRKSQLNYDENITRNTEEREYPIGTVGEFFKLVAEDFEEISDGCREIKKCKWYKVPVKNLDDMCNASNYNKYTIVYYPMISYYPYIKKYGHYLLGYKYDSKGKMKYLVYGIKGTRNKAEQPYGGKSGFVTWVSLKPGEENENSEGYWLMFYDFRTSTIVIPIK